MSFAGVGIGRPATLAPAPTRVATMSILRIATRQSALAMWQAEHVAARLRVAHPRVSVDLVPMTTRGDRILDRPLAEIGGKGLFLKELEVAMLEGRADLAVHSLKDVPMDLEPGFTLGAILERADPADAFISNDYATIAELPSGARVGTSSLRRQSQLRAIRPDLNILDLRGNVNTRLARLDEGRFDAIVLACAGMDRLGFSRRIRARLASPDWVSAVGQGAMAIELRSGDARVADLTRVLDDPDTTRCVTAERAMNHALHGSCHVPVAGYCHETEQGLHLLGLVGDVATGRLLRAEAFAARDQSAALGATVAQQLLDAGAAQMLAAALD